MVTFDFTILQNAECNSFTVSNNNSYGSIGDVTYQAITYTDKQSKALIAIDMTEYGATSPTENLLISIKDGHYDIQWVVRVDEGGTIVEYTSDITTVMYSCFAKCCAVKAIASIKPCASCSIDKVTLIIYAYYNALTQAVNDMSTVEFYTYLTLLEKMCKQLNCNCK